MASTIVVDKIQKTGGEALQWPAADGAANTVLRTTGSGVLEFAADATELLLDTSPQLGADLDCNGSQIQWSKGADVASATALVLLTDGNYFDVTGTVTITSFNTTGGPGTQIKLHFIAACTLTHHATDLKLPGGANILTAAGDTAEFIEYAAGDYICTSYTRATGKAVVGSTAGIATIWVPAVAMKETASNGCASIANVETTSGRPDMNVLDFDDGSDEHAQFQVAFPKSWNAGTVTFQVYWCCTATDTDGVSWGLQGVSVPDNSTIDVAYGTAVVVDDANQGAAEEQLVTDVSTAVTIASAADDCLTYFRIFRDVSDANDTATEDARLLGVKIFFTTDAENDD